VARFTAVGLTIYNLPLSIQKLGLNELFLAQFKASELRVVFDMEGGTQGRHTIFHVGHNLQVAKVVVYCPVVFGLPKLI
jgi:hypothetical protein